MLLGPGVLNLLNTPVYYLYAVSIMVSIDPLLTFAALAPYPIMLLVVKRYSRRLMEGTLHVQEGLSEMSSLIQENVSGIHVVKAYVREEYEVERFREMNGRFRDVSIDLGRARGRSRRDRSVSARHPVVLWLGGRQVARAIDDRRRRRLHRPSHLRRADDGARLDAVDVQRGRAAMQRPRDRDRAGDRRSVSARPRPTCRSRRAERAPGNGKATAPPRPRERARGGQRRACAGGAITHGDNELRGVSFAYPARRRRRCCTTSTHIPSGATVAIVGRAGSGKTTAPPAAAPVRPDQRRGPDRPRRAGLSFATLRRAIASSPQPFRSDVDPRQHRVRRAAAGRGRQGQRMAGPGG
jgi:ABC-type multidrug transport system fused ATPase/permease subunit